MEQKTFKVSGMKCTHCRASVEEALCAVSGVSAAEVSLEAAEAKVSYDPATVSPELLSAAVAASGHFELHV
jgi:copper chaperone